MKIIFVLLISFTRKLGIIFKKEYIYNTSKFIDKYLWIYIFLLYDIKFKIKLTNYILLIFK